MDKEKIPLLVLTLILLPTLLFWAHSKMQTECESTVQVHRHPHRPNNQKHWRGASAESGELTR